MSLRAISNGSSGASQTLIQLSTGLSSADQATVKNNLSLPANAQASGPYVSGRSYMCAPTGVSSNATNTNTLTADTIYANVGLFNASATVSQLSFRTSSSNASSGASVKFAIYALDSSLVPSSRLAMTTTGTTITDAATSVIFSGTLDTPLVLNPGIYAFCLLTTATTTAPRGTIYTTTLPWGGITGGTSPSNAIANTFLIGYTGSATYSTGFPSTFPTATAVTNNANMPIIAFTIA